MKWLFEISSYITGTIGSLHFIYGDKEDAIFTMLVALLFGMLSFKNN